MATRIRTVIWSFFFGLQGYETQGIRLSLRFPLLRGLSGIQSLPVLYFYYGLIIWGLTLYYNNRLMTRPYGSSSFLEPVYGFQRLPVTAIIRIPDLRFNTFFTPPTVSSHRHYRGYGYTIYLVSRTTRSYSPYGLLILVSQIHWYTWLRTPRSFSSTGAYFRYWNQRLRTLIWVTHHVSQDYRHT